MRGVVEQRFIMPGDNTRWPEYVWVEAVMDPSVPPPQPYWLLSPEQRDAQDLARLNMPKARRCMKIMLRVREIHVTADGFVTKSVAVWVEPTPDTIATRERMVGGEEFTFSMSEIFSYRREQAVIRDIVQKALYMEPAALPEGNKPQPVDSRP